MRGPPARLRDLSGRRGGGTSGFVLGTTSCFAPTQSATRSTRWPPPPTPRSVPTAPTNKARDVSNTERPKAKSSSQSVVPARPPRRASRTGQLGIVETQAPLDARKESTFTCVHLTTIQVRTAGSTSVNGATPIGVGMTLDSGNPWMTPLVQFVPGGVVGCTCNTVTQAFEISHADESVSAPSQTYRFEWTPEPSP